MGEKPIVLLFYEIFKLKKPRRTYLSDDSVERDSSSNCSIAILNHRSFHRNY